MPQRRVFPGRAERQRAYRERKNLLRQQLDELREALWQACEEGRCSGLMDHLGEEPAEWLPELIARLKTRKLIVCKRDEKRTNT